MSTKAKSDEGKAASKQADKERQDRLAQISCGGSYTVKDGKAVLNTADKGSK